MSKDKIDKDIWEIRNLTYYKIYILLSTKQFIARVKRKLNKILRGKL